MGPRPAVVLASLLLGSAAQAASQMETCALDGASSCVPPATLGQALGPVYQPSGENLLLQLGKQARVGSRAPSGAMKRVLERHNLYRCMHGVPLMTWSDEIAANAQSWAVESGGQLKHSSSASRKNVGGHSYLGENLAWGVTDEGAIDMFYDEIQKTPGGSGNVDSYDSSTAHYTQVVWKDSTSLGCAVEGRLLVCQYGPGGNIVNGQNRYAQPVSGPVKGRSECEGGASPTPDTTPAPEPTPAPAPPTTSASSPPSTSTTAEATSTTAAPAATALPTTDSPTTPATTASPTTDSPTTDAPTTASPTTDAPTTTPFDGECKDAEGDDFKDKKYKGNCRTWGIWRRLGFSCEEYPELKDDLLAYCPVACGACQPKDTTTHSSWWPWR